MDAEGWMYNDHDDLTRCKFYVGQKGKLPRVGDRCNVINVKLGTEHQCTVSEVFRNTYEWKAKPTVQLEMRLEA